MSKKQIDTQHKKSPKIPQNLPGRGARGESIGHKNRSSAQLGEVRLIGGAFRGRKLPVLPAEGLRPTSDRIRETLFNWVQFQVAGARCLDVFSGSGALGFEALSRGASWLTFLELSVQNARQLVENQVRLNIATPSVQAQQTLPQVAEIIQTDSLVWLEKPAIQPYDLIFLDPPFFQNLVVSALDRLFENGYVSDSTWIYLEQEKALDWSEFPLGWQCFREKTTSQTRLGLWRKLD